MLTNAIKFTMHNTDVTYVVLATEDNYAMIAANRYTRQIQIVEMFSFLFAKELNAPAFMIEQIVNEYLDEMTAIEESEEFANDEMVGTY
jgi:inosine-uridine nucleoside N-ribohydrolase